MKEHCPPEPFALYPPCTLPDWDTKASVRTDRSPYTLPADLEHQLGERHWFVPDFMPYLDHPDIVLAGPSVVRRLEANQLVYFLDYTTVLEHKLVNRSVETLIHDELGVPVPCAVKTAALQLYTDEGYHALFSIKSPNRWPSYMASTTAHARPVASAACWSGYRHAARLTRRWSGF